MSNHDDDKEHDGFIANVDSDLEDLVPGYLEGRYDDIDAILKALEEKNYEAIRIMGHTMKGSGGGYGFDAITDLGRSIENAAREGNHQEIIRFTNDLKEYLDNVEIIYV